MIEDIAKIADILPNLMMEMLAALVCGGLIGLERGVRNKVAGLRENILICLGVVLFVNLNDLVGGKDEYTLIIASIVILGVGMISAGIVLKGSGKAGLASAAKLWVVAAIGLIIGLNQWLLGMLVTGLSLLILTLLHSLEKNLVGEPPGMLLKLNVRGDSKELRENIKGILEKYRVNVTGFHVEPAPFGVKLTVQGSSEPEDIRPLIGQIWTLADVTEVEH